MNMMADARVTTLKAQAADAARTHLDLPRGLTQDALRGIVAFEEQIYAAQARDLFAGDLTHGSSGFGPRNLASAPAGVLGNNTTRYVFPLGDAWPERPSGTDADSTPSSKRVPPSHAATMCSCSARSSSATRCT